MMGKYKRVDRKACQFMDLISITFSWLVQLDPASCPLLATILSCDVKVNRQENINQFYTFKSPPQKFFYKYNLFIYLY